MSTLEANPTVRKPPSKAQLRKATKWLKAMRAEAAAKRIYLEADEPRAKERARKLWLARLAEWSAVGRINEEALRIVREQDRSDR